MDEITKKYFDASKVRVLDFTEGKAFSEWFENDLEKIARISGAPSDSSLEIHHMKGGFELKAKGPYIQGTMTRQMLQHDGQVMPMLFLKNAEFELPPNLRGQKIGVRSIAIELFEAKKTKQFAYVEVHAIGDFSKLDPSVPNGYYNGYLVWPQLGFDGPVPKNKVNEFHPCKLVSEVLKSHDGLTKWTTDGDCCHLRFDLSDNSPSWVVLNNYMRDNAIKVN